MIRNPNSILNELVTSVDKYQKLYDLISKKYSTNIEFDNDVKRLSTTCFIDFDIELFLNNDSSINLPGEILKGSQGLY